LSTAEVPAIGEQLVLARVLVMTEVFFAAWLPAIAEEHQ